MAFFSIIILTLTGLIFSIGALSIGRFFVRKSSNIAKELPYECGLPTIGKSIHQQHVGYYMFALMFLIFDVELIFLFPWAVVVKQIGLKAVAEIAFFIFILFIGFLYAHKLKALEWK